MDELRPLEVVLVRRVEPARGVESAFRKLERRIIDAASTKGDDAPLKKSTIDDDGVTVETGLRSPSPGPSASTKVKVTPGIDETDL